MCCVYNNIRTYSYTFLNLFTHRLWWLWQIWDVLASKYSCEIDLQIKQIISDSPDLCFQTDLPNELFSQIPKSYYVVGQNNTGFLFSLASSLTVILISFSLIDGASLQTIIINVVTIMRTITIIIISIITIIPHCHDHHDQWQGCQMHPTDTITRNCP